ncbi:MAG: hypothetical protein AAF725_08940, partial [Acidobacteriota bacterium]
SEPAPAAEVPVAPEAIAPEPPAPPGAPAAAAPLAPAVLETPTPPPAEAPPAPAVPLEAPESAPAPQAAAVQPDEDLVAEAKVFSKYGLREKAIDRLNVLLGRQPTHLGALALRAHIDLEAGDVESAVAGANLVSRLARESGDAAAWDSLRPEFEEAGFFEVDGELTREAPAAKPAAPAHDDRISQLLEDLSLESFEAPAPAPTPSAVDSLLSQELGSAAPAAPPADSSASGSQQLFSLADELAIDGLEESAAAPPAPAAPSGAELMDETGMSWLDDPTPAPEAAAAGAVETLFDEEDDFFDLAAELEDELGSEINDVALTSVEPQEQSLEEIIEGFKQGVAENLSSEDYDTHFNLGIAYREMGLLDEAIGEFQLASKDPRYLVECSSMLGICFLEKGLPELAIRWYQKGLAAPDIREEATLGMLYDMGSAYEGIQEYEKAYKAFVEIYGFNTNFRDVSAKLQELAPLQT